MQIDFAQPGNRGRMLNIVLTSDQGSMRGAIATTRRNTWPGDPGGSPAWRSLNSESRVGSFAGFRISTLIGSTIPNGGSKRTASYTTTHLPPTVTSTFGAERGLPFAGELP